LRWRRHLETDSCTQQPHARTGRQQASHRQLSAHERPSTLHTRAVSTRVNVSCNKLPPSAGCASVAVPVAVPVAIPGRRHAPVPASPHVVPARGQRRVPRDRRSAVAGRSECVLRVLRVLRGRRRGCDVARCVTCSIARGRRRRCREKRLRESLDRRLCRPPQRLLRLQLRGELSDLRVGGRLHRLELSRRSLPRAALGR